MINTENYMSPCHYFTPESICLSDFLPLSHFFFFLTRFAVQQVPLLYLLGPLPLYANASCL